MLGEMGDGLREFVDKKAYSLAASNVMVRVQSDTVDEEPET